MARGLAGPDSAPASCVCRKRPGGRIGAGPEPVTDGNPDHNSSATVAATAGLGALARNGRQIPVHGRTPGEVSLLIWDELERSRSFDLRVDVDVSACADEEHRVFPDEQISVTPSRAAIVLSGHVSTEDVAKRAGELASAYSPKVVNVLTFGPVGAQEVLLQVKFAEVDRR